MDSLANGLEELGGGEARPDIDRHIGQAHLHARAEHQRTHPAKRITPEIHHHTNDFSIRLGVWTTSESHMAAQWVTTLQVGTHESFVDDHHLGGAGQFILLGEFPAQPQRNAQGSTVVTRDGVTGGYRVLAFLGLVTFHDNSLGPGV